MCGFAAVGTFYRLNIWYVAVFPAGGPYLGASAATLMIAAVAYLAVGCEYLACCFAYGLYGTLVHAAQTLVALAVVISADMIALVVRVLHGSHRP